MLEDNNSLNLCSIFNNLGSSYLFEPVILTKNHSTMKQIISLLFTLIVSVSYGQVQLNKEFEKYARKLDSLFLKKSIEAGYFDYLHIMADRDLDYFNQSPDKFGLGATIIKYNINNPALFWQIP